MTNVNQNPHTHQEIKCRLQIQNSEARPNYIINFGGIYDVMRLHQLQEKSWGVRFATIKNQWYVGMCVLLLYNRDVYCCSSTWRPTPRHSKTLMTGNRWSLHWASSTRSQKLHAPTLACLMRWGTSQLQARIAGQVVEAVHRKGLPPQIIC